MQAGQGAGDIGCLVTAVTSSWGPQGLSAQKAAPVWHFPWLAHVSGWANMVKMDFELAKNKCLPIPPVCWRNHPP